MSIGSSTHGAPASPKFADSVRLISPVADNLRPHGVGRTTMRPSADRDSVYRGLLVAADVLAVAGVSLASIFLAGRNKSGFAALLAVPLVVLVSRLAGTYDRGDLLVRRTTLDEVPALFQLATLLAVVVWLIENAVAKGGTDSSQLVLTWLGLFALLLIFRAAARLLARLMTPPERCLLIGDDTSCDVILAKFARLRSLHAAVVAIADPESVLRDFDAQASSESFRELLVANGIDRVVVTMAGTEEHELVGMLDTVVSAGRKVSVLPTVFEVLGPPMELDHLEGVPLLSTRSLGLPPGSRFVKRGVDVLGSAVGTVVLGPFVAVIALWIKLDSSGPVLFRQLRIGRDGKPFVMLKFRTMIHGADEQKQELYHLNEAVGLFKIATDPRVTRFGRLLRRTSLDELPQLLNVLRGDMSLVGPRPLIEGEDDLVEGWRRRRLQLKPGMTGHWQVSGSARIPLNEMARIDYLYLTNWSLWLDIKILIRTIPFMLSARGL